MQAKNVNLSKYFLVLMGLVMLILTSACKSQDTHKGSGSQQAPVKQPLNSNGGADGGGGDVIEDEPMSATKLSRIMAQDKFIIKVALNFQAYLYEIVRDNNIDRTSGSFKGMDMAKVRALYSRMFGSSEKNVYDELRAVKFVWRDEVCHDTKFQDKDASAFNSDPAEICVSKTTILAKLTRNTGTVLATSLLGHELVHRMGGSEEEAKMFQILIQRSMVTGLADSVLSGVYNLEFQLALETLNKNYLDFENIYSADAVDTCLRLSYLTKHADVVLDNGFQLSGVTRYMPHTRKVIAQASSITRILMHYCTKESSEKRAYFDRKPAPAYIRYMDKAALQFNFEVLKANFEVVFKDLEENGMKPGQLCLMSGWGSSCVKRD